MEITESGDGFSPFPPTFLLKWDYCNSILAGLTQSTTISLQGVQNAAARLIKSLGPCDHITPALRELHWLPIKHRVIYKLCLLMRAVHVGRCPGYIADIVTPTSSLPGRDRLRSAAGNRYELPAIHHKLGERAFSHAGPAAWNSLPSYITATIDTETFKYRLKTTYLYSLAYCF